MDPQSVYILQCPFSLEPRYVGISDNPHRRLMGHLQMGSNPKTPVGKWSKETISRGKDPIMWVVEENATYQVEMWWVNALEAEGAQLLNVDKRSSRLKRTKEGFVPQCRVRIHPAESWKNPVAAARERRRQEYADWEPASIDFIIQRNLNDLVNGYPDLGTRAAATRRLIYHLSKEVERINAKKSGLL